MNKGDKPEGEKAGWHLLETTYPFATKWLKLRQDRVQLKGKGEITFTYVDNPGAVVIVPVIGDGNLALIRQYRYTVDEWCLEVPAGGIHDAEGASLAQVACKELLEEIGGTCSDLSYVTHFYASNGNSAQPFHVFLALGVELQSRQTLEETELIEIYSVPIAKALELARSGRIRDGASALAILLCENRLREQGYL